MPLLVYRLRNVCLYRLMVISCGLVPEGKDLTSRWSLAARDRLGEMVGPRCHLHKSSDSGESAKDSILSSRGRIKSTWLTMLAARCYALSSTPQNVLHEYPFGTTEIPASRQQQSCQQDKVSKHLRNLGSPAPPTLASWSASAHLLSAEFAPTGRLTGFRNLHHAHRREQTLALSHPATEIEAGMAPAEEQSDRPRGVGSLHRMRFSSPPVPRPSILDSNGANMLYLTE